VIDRDYTGGIGVILVNLFNYDYHVQQGDKIAQLIPEKVLETQCQEVNHIEETDRGAEGFGSTDRKKIEIDEISTRTFKKSKRHGDKVGRLWGRYNNRKLELLVTNVSTELAIQSKKGQKGKKPHRDSPRRILGLPKSLSRRRSDQTTTTPTRGRPRNQHRKREAITPEENISPGSQRIRRTWGIYKDKQKKRMDTRFVR